MKQPSFLFVLLLIIITISCKKDDIQVEFDYSKFSEMKQSWEKLGINSYSYTFLHNGCLCYGYHYGVNYNQVVTVEPDTSTCHTVGPYLTTTIDEIFSNLERLYKNPYSNKIDDNTYIRCKSISVEYDSIYFFPRYYEILYEAKNMELDCPQIIESIKDFEN